MSRQNNPEERPANQEAPGPLLRLSDKGRFRLNLGLLLSSCVEKGSGPETVATLNATLLGASLVGAGIAGIVLRKRG